jgi:glycosyltransferase involved in cell wall biosynthesis
MSDTLPNPVDVSIAICTYNRAGYLRDAVASMQALATEGVGPYEIVIVDNASTDETSQVIAEVAHNSPVPVVGAYEAKPGVAAARNRAIREAHGPWIAFFDDDQVADRQWLIELFATAREKGCRCVGGRNLLRLPPGGPYHLGQEVRGLLGEADKGLAACRCDPRNSPATNNLLIHKSVFDEIGVFDENARDGGEDTDLFRRIFAANIEAWYTPQAFSFHIVPPYRLTPAYLRWKALRAGGHIARRNWKDRGRVRYLFELVARAGQVGCIHVPVLAWCWMSGNRAALLDRRCLMWRSEGYLRYALSFLAPRLFAQRRFFEQLEFRSEREMFADKAEQPAQAAP